jgi:hypothetical protein
MLRESMLAMAVRIEVVFIFAGLRYGLGLLGFDLAKAGCLGIKKKRTFEIQSRDYLLYVCSVNSDSILAGWSKKDPDALNHTSAASLGSCRTV